MTGRVGLDDESTGRARYRVDGLDTGSDCGAAMRPAHTRFEGKAAAVSLHQSRRRGGRSVTKWIGVVDKGV